MLLHFSDHKVGKFKNDSFWSQLQSSIAQSIGLLIASLSLWKRFKKERQNSWDENRRQRKRYWAWIVPTIVSFLCAVLAIPLYVVAPTDWSAFMSMVSIAIQTLVIAQLALTGDA